MFCRNTVVHPVHYLVIQQINKQKQNEQQKWKNTKITKIDFSKKKINKKGWGSVVPLGTRPPCFTTAGLWKREKLKVDYRLKIQQKKMKKCIHKKNIHIIYPKKPKKIAKCLKNWMNKNGNWNNKVNSEEERATLRVEHSGISEKLAREMWRRDGTHA